MHRLISLFSIATAPPPRFLSVRAASKGRNTWAHRLGRSRAVLCCCLALHSILQQCLLVSQHLVQQLDRALGSRGPRAAGIAGGAVSRGCRRAVRGGGGGVPQPPAASPERAGLLGMRVYCVALTTQVSEGLEARADGRASLATAAASEEDREAQQAVRNC